MQVAIKSDNNQVSKQCKLQSGGARYGQDPAAPHADGKGPAWARRAARTGSTTAATCDTLVPAMLRPSISGSLTSKWSNQSIKQSWLYSVLFHA